MKSAETVLAKREAGARESGAAPDKKRARHGTLRNDHDVDAPPRTLPVKPTAVKNRQKRHERVRREDEVSGASSRSARWNDPVRENIIGRTSTLVVGGFGGRSRSFAEDGAFALIHEPAGEHGGSVFLEVLIEEGAQFLAEIGGVGEAGEFIGLERIAGGGEQELPRRLSVIGVHENLLKQVLWKRQINGNTDSTIVTSNPEVTGLWKSVENKENVWGACSGCAGDYEDPDRSAWEAEPEEEEEDTAVEEIAGKDGAGAAGDEKENEGE